MGDHDTLGPEDAAAKKAIPGPEDAAARHALDTDDVEAHKFGKWTAVPDEAGPDGAAAKRAIPEDAGPDEAARKQ